MTFIGCQRVLVYDDLKCQLSLYKANTIYIFQEKLFLERRVQAVRRGIADVIRASRAAS